MGPRFRRRTMKVLSVWQPCQRFIHNSEALAMGPFIPSARRGPDGSQRWGRFHKKRPQSPFLTEPQPDRIRGVNVERGPLVFEVTVVHGATDSAGVPGGYVEDGRREYAADAQKEKARSRRSKRGCGLLEKIPAATYSPTQKMCSTIGAKELNFRVRDGIGCGLLAITTGEALIDRE